MVRKKIAVLGSTGSIGNTLLKIVDKNKSNFNIILLTANKDYKTLLKQAIKFKVKNLIITNSNSYKILKNKCKKLNIKVYNNFDNLNIIFKKKIDYVMNSIVGFSGLEPTVDIIKYTKKIAIANKESIICGWNLIQKKLKKYKTEIIPVDSEHFSIWSLLNSYKIDEKLKLDKVIQNMIITASGGPFLNTKINEFKKIKVKNAIKHPTWKMGKKISIDSATLVNKLFEVIEAQRLFGVKINKIHIKIHPDSYIHCVIKFKNGLIKFCAHEPDMSIPILNSLNINKDFGLNKSINFKILNNLKFSNVNKKKFLVISLLKNYPNHCTLYDTALVSINDVLVNLFLENKIKFPDISQYLIKILKTNEIKKLKNIVPKNYNEIRQINDFVRLKTSKLCIC